MEKQTKNDESKPAPQMPQFLKSNGIFFSILFLVWMGMVFFMNIAHPYFSSPLPNELQSLQAEQATSAQQEQQAR